MNDEDIERAAVQELLQEAKKTEDSLKPSRQVGCINKRLLCPSLASTLRNPVVPKPVSKRKYVGLDDPHFDEEKKQPARRPDDGRNYDPDANYIYDARRYFDPEKYREIVANRQKKEEILKAKSQHNKAAAAAGSAAAAVLNYRLPVSYYQSQPTRSRSSSGYVHHRHRRKLNDGYRLKQQTVVGIPPSLLPERDKYADDDFMSAGSQHGKHHDSRRHRHKKSKSKASRHRNEVRSKSAHKHSRRKHLEGGGIEHIVSDKDRKRLLKKLRKKDAKKTELDLGKGDHSHRHHKHSRSRCHTDGTLALDAGQHGGEVLLDEEHADPVDKNEVLLEPGNPNDLSVWRFDCVQKDRRQVYDSDSDASGCSWSEDEVCLPTGSNQSVSSDINSDRKSYDEASSLMSPSGGNCVVNCDNKHTRNFYYYDDVNV
jgi:hypothetical protein